LFSSRTRYNKWYHEDESQPHLSCVMGVGSNALIEKIAVT